MPAPRIHLTGDLDAEFAAIRERQGVTASFPIEATTLAESRAAAPSDAAARGDHREVEFLSMDPAGSRDLDQALHLERHGSGYRFRYAIADVASWVQAGDPIDTEARVRGETIYCPDLRIPLHPVALSEGAASLLADQDRPALVWTIDLDQRGEIVDIAAERSVVRNRRALSYAFVQSELDAGSTDEQFRLIEEIGTLRRNLETERGGVSLDLPEQSVDRDGDHYTLSYSAALTVEGHNAQLSLCCGIAAARLMTEAGFGIIRTLPPAEAVTIDRIRASSLALGQPWPDAMTYPEWVRTLDASGSTGAALMTQAAHTLRGAGYLAFDGDLPASPESRVHSAIAAEYAHVTAPLRRLVDRFANECVIAAAAGTRPPGWVLEALPLLPELMSSAGHRSSAVDHAIVDLMEAAVLTHRIGEVFDATVISRSKAFSTIQIHEPAVIATITDPADLGSTIRVRLDAADVAGPTVRFTAVSGTA